MDTMEIVNRLDDLHRKYQKAYLIYVIPIVLIFFGFPVIPKLDIVAGAVFGVLLLAVSSGFLFASNTTSWMNRQYQELYKNVFVVSVLNQMFSDVQVNWEHGFTRQDIEQMGILKLGNQFSSEDLIRGTYEGISFVQADIVIWNESGSGADQDTTTYFQGRVFVFDLDKSSIHSVAVCSKNFQYYGNLNGIHHDMVRLESESFNRKFKVMATYPVDAFYVLTPQVMECVNALYQRTGNIAMRYLGRKLYVAVNTKGNAFDGNIRKKFVYVDEINKIKEDCSLIVDIIRQLRIGTVQ